MSVRDWSPLLSVSAMYGGNAVDCPRWSGAPSPPTTYQPSAASVRTIPMPATVALIAWPLPKLCAARRRRAWSRPETIETTRQPSPATSHIVTSGRTCPVATGTTVRLRSAARTTNAVPTDAKRQLPAVWAVASAAPSQIRPTATADSHNGGSPAPAERPRNSHHDGTVSALASMGSGPVSNRHGYATREGNHGASTTTGNNAETIERIRPSRRMPTMMRAAAPAMYE